MYNSVESWKLNLLLKKVLKGTLTVGEVPPYQEEFYAETLGNLIEGFPPIQIFVHRGKILGDYFSLLYTALTKEGEVVIETGTLEVIGGWDLLDINQDEDENVIPVTDLMSSIKFFEATKNLDQETTHRLSMLATRLYETVFPIIKVDDELDRGDLIEYVNNWFISGW